MLPIRDADQLNEPFVDLSQNVVKEGYGSYEFFVLLRIHATIPPVEFVRCGAWAAFSLRGVFLERHPMKLDNNAPSVPLATRTSRATAGTYRTIKPFRTNLCTFALSPSARPVGNAFFWWWSRRMLPVASDSIGCR